MLASQTTFFFVINEQNLLIIDLHVLSSSSSSSNYKLSLCVQKCQTLGFLVSIISHNYVCVFMSLQHTHTQWGYIANPYAQLSSFFSSFLSLPCPTSLPIFSPSPVRFLCRVFILSRPRVYIFIFLRDIVYFRLTNIANFIGNPLSYTIIQFLISPCRINAWNDLREPIFFFDPMISWLVVYMMHIEWPPTGTQLLDQ